MPRIASEKEACFFFQATQASNIVLMTKILMTKMVYNFENYDLEFAAQRGLSASARFFSVSNFDIRISNLFCER
ncbi:MAG: hypothetical protein A3H51_00435 [Candidatus Spechtbacteria bacterium RIFCSPLOWO2_02_FULL_38_8]|uniref:Uncharacterized protein n=1 Tax=Candidatus Spechtbacteria bacterium RIFCSPLOWO2_02_FULL_38_8 TaxID=1802164 RepID=A0A1G2HLK3_9BACT|nr:MAG: hypothetical protein A3H51_00435 [Candidatus Spechtbacteria bacterium RIFCSPLOWO2_02_FULL_38_8]